MTDVAIIGAGPYGLSIAAHLKGRGVDFRIFGSPMRTWISHMPKGMMLKSVGAASSLYDPSSAFPLSRYCKEKGVPYRDEDLPVKLETFSSYGLEFQKRFVPELENHQVVSLQRTGGGFQLYLSNGEFVKARRIVVAVGLSYFDHVPPVLAQLPQELLTHSSRHSNLEEFNGREVAIVGGGASGADLAALLHQAGASVQLIARRPRIAFHDPPSKDPRSLWQQIRRPMTGIGAGWKLYFCANAPGVFRLLPEELRFEAVRRILGPAPGWFVREQVEGRVPFHLGVNIANAEVRNGRVNLALRDAAGDRKNVVAEHVIAATGYVVDLRRIAFLGPDLLGEIRVVNHTPVLSSAFESSVPGLYFVGTSAAYMFGPVLRFAVGARFTARRLSAHLSRSASHRGSLKGLEAA